MAIKYKQKEINKRKIKWKRTVEKALHYNKYLSACILTSYTNTYLYHVNDRSEKN